MHSRTSTKLIVLLALACATVSARQSPPAAKAAKAAKATERAAAPKLLLRGINIAEFKFTVERAPVAATVTGTTARAANLVFKGDVLARGWFRKLFGIDFHYNTESVVDPASFLILSNSTRDEQGKRLRTSESVFDRTHNTLTWTLRNPNDPQSQPRVVTAPLQNASHDLISAIYFLRTQPLEPGRQLELVISDSGAVYRIPVKVGARKWMKTIVGRVQAVRVDIEIFGADRLVDRKGEMTLWITHDARRLPVRARVNTDIGTLDINLKKVSGGNAPG